jgi:hypothetical protein
MSNLGLLGRGAKDDKSNSIDGIFRRRHQRGENGGQPTSCQIFWPEEGTEVCEIFFKSIVDSRAEEWVHIDFNLDPQCH